MINVFISPNFLNKRDTGDGGIRRVVEAMIKHLPEFGIQNVADLHQAQIIINHGAMQTKARGIPIININHGLYWSRQAWGNSYQEVNAEVVEAMCMAVAHTVPSEWVARAVRRGGLFYPTVVYHGIDHADFVPQAEHDDFVLWNKARADYVSDPEDMQKVAARMPDTQFLTTIGRQTENVKVIGITNYTQMKEIVAKAGVYLCTARETFGIGTLEAMAYGIPIAGWDWGGQSEIVIQGETGYLAPPGDFVALAECIRKCKEERARLSENAIEDVKKRWGWKPRIQQYAEIVQGVYRDYYETKRPKVSVIITAYKLDAYLPVCLESVTKQTFRDFECLVVDDAAQETTRRIVEGVAGQDRRIKYIPVPNNFGLPGARNFGFNNSSGRYIRFLDADDFLAENALELEAKALDDDPGIHIVYGHLESVREDGTRILIHGEPVRGEWPPEDFNWLEQMAHLNQLPSCVMMRRGVMTRSGGYRERMKRQEDADFWCRVTSLGFRAKKITQAVTYFHRQREDSKGAIEWKNVGREPDWTAWFPWRIGATDYREAVSLLRKYSGRHPAPHLVPFGAQGKSPIENFWYVHDFAYPVVSIIVTCGPGHKPYLQDALDSIWAQTYLDWECVVVNDSGEEWGRDIMGAPWAMVVNTPGKLGTAAARNEGYKYAHGKLIVWLDADDYWMPWYLEMMVAYAEKNRGIIFSDLIMDNGKEKKIYKYPEFNPKLVIHGMRYPGSSIIVPRAITEAVLSEQGGWDTQIPGMEDWDYQITAHSLGFCAYHLPEALFVYRMYSSTKREVDYAKIDLIRDYLDKKWFKYRKGGEEMSCGCGGTKVVTTKPRSALSSSGNFDLHEANADEVGQTQVVQVEYVGPLSEDFSIRSRLDRSIFYRFGNNEYHKERPVFAADVEYLTSLVDGEGKPLYRLVGTIAATENRDPSVFLGEAVQA